MMETVGGISGSGGASAVLAEAGRDGIGAAGAHGRERRVEVRTIRVVRIGSVLAAVGWFVLAAGLYVRADWATVLWPWPDVRMSFIFLASIAAAIGAPVLWFGLSGELAGIAGGGLDLAIAGGGISGYLLLRVVRDGERDLRLAAGFFALFALGNLALFWWSRAIPVRDPRPMPPFVRGTFVVFALTLLAVGSALALQVDHIFPWDLSPRSSTVFGWVFLGASAYFLYGVVRPRWVFAVGTLWGFLAYDLVLFSPYIALLTKDADSAAGFDPYGYGVTTGGGNGVNESSLTIYLIVLSASTLLAIWALGLRRETRVWRGL